MGKLRLIAGILVCMLGLTLFGCGLRAKQPVVPPANQSATQSSVAPAPSRSLSAMDFSKVKSDISPEFPPEMAVIEGEVLYAKQQGLNYDYQLSVPDTNAEAVFDWYSRALADRQWQPQYQTREQAKQPNGSYLITWTKHGAVQSFRFIATDDGGVGVTVTLSTSGDLMLLQ